MERAALHEGARAEVIGAGLADGSIAVPANRNHACVEGRAVGRGMKTKINVNLGVSRDCHDASLEWAKAEMAVRMGADAIMDLSAYGRTAPFRQRLIQELPVPIGTVPVYDILGFTGLPLEALTAEHFLSVLDKARGGWRGLRDAACGRQPSHAGAVEKTPAHHPGGLPGGSRRRPWMQATGARESLRRALRPGAGDLRGLRRDPQPGRCHAARQHGDATDGCQISELIDWGISPWRLGSATCR